MPAEPLTQKETEDRLRELPGWSLDGDRIARSYRLPGHFAATAMVVHIAQIQEELGHHSDLTLGYNSVALSVHTRRGRRDHRQGLRTGPPGRGGRSRARRRLRSCPQPPAYRRTARGICRNGNTAPAIGAGRGTLAA